MASSASSMNATTGSSAAGPAPAAAEGREADEVLHHLCLYADERCLIQWHDAFANGLLLDAALPEATVAALAKPFGVRYGR
jgi:hypothetical protein